MSLVYLNVYGQNYALGLSTGSAMAYPLGVMFWVSDNVNINVSYQFNWLLSSYLSEDASQSANLGVGFQF